jgi:hypothetical protein
MVEIYIVTTFKYKDHVPFLGYMILYSLRDPMRPEAIQYSKTLVMTLSDKMPPYGYDAYPLMMTMAGRNGF